MLLAAGGASVESAGTGLSLLFIELGVVVVGLAVLARASEHVGFSPIPFYLLAGLAFGEGGLLPLRLSEGFVEVGAEIGVLLLLFMLGLEYTAEELQDSLRAGWRSGVVDLGLNFTPGLAMGLLLGWDALTAVLLGGVTYISSSGVIAKVLSDLGRLGNRETPAILSLLVMEDLFMAIYLPGVAIGLAAAGIVSGLVSLGVAALTVSLVFFLALRYGEQMSRVIFSHSDEAVLLSTLGVVLLVAGVAQRLQVSAAVGAFLVGIAVSGPVAERAGTVVGPLRDLFAAVFFFFFGLQASPSAIPPVAGAALLLGLVTAGTKVGTGWWSAKRMGVGIRGRWRAGAALIARGEFSIVIAGLGAGTAFGSALRPLATAYVLLMAAVGPIAARMVEPLLDAIGHAEGEGVGAARRRSRDVD